MTIQAVGWVLDHSTTTGSDRLVLIAIANHVNKETGAAFPGYETIAREAGVSRSTAMRCVHELEVNGHVSVTRSTGRGHSNTYRIPPYEEWSQRDTLYEKGSHRPPERVANAPVKGSNCGTLTNEPSNEPRETVFDQPKIDRDAYKNAAAAARSALG